VGFNIQIAIEIAGWLVALITLVLYIWRDRKLSSSEHDDQVRDAQKLSDKMDNLAKDVSKIQVMLTSIAEKEDGHGRLLTEHSTKLNDHEQRIQRIESRCDDRLTVG
jgi:peptidoglycan hydrolase CwlO-like protein